MDHKIGSKTFKVGAAVCRGVNSLSCTITPLSLSLCYTEFGQGRGTLRNNPLSLSWCYTEFGQGRAAGLGDVTIKQVSHFQARNTPVPFLVLHRVRAGGLWVFG